MKNYLNNKLETLTVCAHSYLLHQLRAKETVFQRRRGTGGHFRHWYPESGGWVDKTLHYSWTEHIQEHWCHPHSVRAAERDGNSSKGTWRTHERDVGASLSAATEKWRWCYNLHLNGMRETQNIRGDIIKLPAWLTPEDKENMDFLVDMVHMVQRWSAPWQCYSACRWVVHNVTFQKPNLEDFSW